MVIFMFENLYLNYYMFLCCQNFKCFFSLSNRIFLSLKVQKLDGTLLGLATDPVASIGSFINENYFGATRSMCSTDQPHYQYQPPSPLSSRRGVGGEVIITDRPCRFQWLLYQFELFRSDGVDVFTTLSPLTLVCNLATFKEAKIQMFSFIVLSLFCQY